MRELINSCRDIQNTLIFVIVPWSALCCIDVACPDRDRRDSDMRNWCRTKRPREPFRKTECVHTG